MTPATPLFKTTHYDKLNMDDYPIGVNAFVVVVSYTVSLFTFQKKITSGKCIF